MVNFTNETPILLTDAAARLHIQIRTIRVWAKGVNGRQLETAKLGRKTYTTLEAIQRFSISTEPSYRPSQQSANEAKEQLKSRHGI